MAPDRLRTLADVILGDNASGHCHGAVVIVSRQGRIALHEIIGQYRSDDARPPHNDSVFNLLSITKAFTNVLMLRARERG